MDLKICRICLGTEVKVYDLNTFHLKSYYENLMALEVNSGDRLPLCVCYECAALLHKFHKFKEKSQHGLKTLTELWLNGTLSYESIYTLERRSLLLKCKTVSFHGGSQKDVISPRELKEPVIDDCDNVVSCEILIEKEPGVKDEETGESAVEEERPPARLHPARLHPARWARRALPAPRGCLAAAALRRHGRLRHSKVAGPHECRVCRVRLRSAHHATHHALYRCRQCGYQCSTERSALLHDATHDEPTRARPRGCRAGGHNGDSIDKSKKIQGKRLRTKIKKKSDTKSNTDDIVMSVISVSQPAPAAPRRKHKKTKVNERKPTTCYQCGRHFGTQLAYTRHHRRRHAGTSPHAPAARHVCELCGASLAPGSVAGHQNMHSRERLFPCEACGRTFGSNVGLKRHAVTHTGEKRFPCPLCDKRFTQSNSMKLHYRTFHLKQPYPKRSPRKPKEPRPAEPPPSYLTLE